MIKIENTETYGFEAAVRGMRNPMNSWSRSDSKWDGFGDADGYSVGEDDLGLMKKLVKAGSDHSKFMRMINVTCDITAPLYWWKEFDTYKVGTVANSCSTMHKIHAKEFTMDDFSTDQLKHLTTSVGVSWNTKQYFEQWITLLNVCRGEFLKTNDKAWWWQMIQLLPTSYNQKRTVQLNYAVLQNMYHARKNHKLNEWQDFCKWVLTLPYARDLIELGEGNK